MFVGGGTGMNTLEVRERPGQEGGGGGKVVLVTVPFSRFRSFPSSCRYGQCCHSVSQSVVQVNASFSIESLDE